MSTNYVVVLEKYAERHYVSNFKKKHKGAWDITWEAIVEEFRRMDSLFETTIAETIAEKGNIKICKTEFRVAKTQESRHGSGNRCIVAVAKSTCTVHVLLVYGKNDIAIHNETAEWKHKIRENYPEYSDWI
ncbi:MAG TPA: hypothetical protein VI953_03770 [Candidatus Paceibacterota bacterium]